MNPILRNIAGLVLGALIGGFVNSSIVAVGPNIIPPPEGAIEVPQDGDFDAAISAIKQNLPLYGPKDWIVPFAAHAIGTLVGALLAALICATHKKTFALVIGGLFFIGGISMAFLLDFPMPFSAIDLLGAYFPMGWLGWKLAGAK